jgi:LPPG:FO 2-phospho-L-lactate transferase
MKIVSLAGGVGAARLLRGLTQLVAPNELLIIGNTGDDFELYGLHISPDLDIVMYTLAGIVDEGKGWGIRNDTFNALATLGRLGFETWFRLGDQDLATHIVRTGLLKDKRTLSQATAELCRMYNVKHRIVPMTDQPVHTRIVSGNETLDFQEYFVKKHARCAVTNVKFQGAKTAQPAPGIIKAIKEAQRIIICPSNPVLSIAPILAIPEIRQAMLETQAYKIAVSPIVAGKTIKGPAARVMTSMKLDASAFGVAKYYKDYINEIIIDRADFGEARQILKLNMKATVTNTVMTKLEDSIHLSMTALETR